MSCQTVEHSLLNTSSTWLSHSPSKAVKILCFIRSKVIEIASESEVRWGLKVARETVLKNVMAIKLKSMKYSIYIWISWCSFRLLNTECMWMYIVYIILNKCIFSICILCKVRLGEGSKYLVKLFWNWNNQFEMCQIYIWFLEVLFSCSTLDAAEYI